MEGTVFRKALKIQHTQLAVKPGMLPQHQLPTGADVVGRIMLMRLEEMQMMGVKENRVSIQSIIARVAEEVMDIWNRATIPTKKKQKVQDIIRKLWMLKENVRKHPSSVKYQSEVGKRMTELLDIANSAVPPKEAGDRAFLEDQRMARRLFIDGSLDRATTERWRRQELRRSRVAESGAAVAAAAPPVTMEASPVTASATDSVSDQICLTDTAIAGRPSTRSSVRGDTDAQHASSYGVAAAATTTAVMSTAGAAEQQPSSSESDDNDADYEPPWRHRKRVKINLDMTPVAEAVDGCEIGARKASKLLSVFSATTTQTPVTRAKVQWALDKSRKEKVNSVGDTVSQCSAVFCDGRNDFTQVVRDGSRQQVIVHNISVNMHPGDVYVGHFTCSSRHTGEGVAKQLRQFLLARGVALDKVQIVGGDGTNSVVGAEGGWMAKLESMLGRPLTRAICLTHQAELPYRALFKTLDGQTKGPNTWSGVIGRRLSGPVHTLPVVEFAPVPCADFPVLTADVEASLSKDFQLLFQCARCVTTGECDPSVARRVHAKVNMARWFTAQSRLLRLYMAEPQPSPELTTLAQYIVRVYLPTVVGVKAHSDLVDAPRHLFLQMRRQRDLLGGDDLSVAQQSLARNAWMAHPENVLLGMLGDNDANVRKEAVVLIQDARKRRQPGASLRKFQCPAAPGINRPVKSDVSRPLLNLGATNYREMVDLDRAARNTDVEPPCVRGLTDTELEDAISVPFKTGVPCHTQSTERAVKLTTEAALCVMGSERQDGVSLNKLTFRRHVMQLLVSRYALHVRCRGGWHGGLPCEVGAGWESAVMPHSRVMISRLFQ